MPKPIDVLPDGLDDPAGGHDEQLYGSPFWVAYVANFLLTASNSLTFRFSDFVAYLGGNATTIGLIWGAGTGVSVAVRIWLGWLVDRHGTRQIWLWSTAAFAGSLFAMLPLDGLGASIYLLRIAYSCALAGVFSCSIVHLASQVAPHRRAELIGSLGTSGFLGMLTGPQIGDWVLRCYPTGGVGYDVIFGLAGVLGVVYFALALYLTRVPDQPSARRSAPLSGLVVRYWPGALVGVAMMMGVGLVVPFTFLTRYAAYRHMDGIGVFFAFYSPTAFVLRIMGRQWPERFGRERTVVFGLACVSLSMLLYLPVRAQSHLVAAALAAGVGHALLFPSVTTLGAECFPERYRATGTSLILSFLDVGVLISAPTFGWIIDRWGFATMFVSASATVAAVAVAYAVQQFRGGAAREPASESICAATPPVAPESA